MNTEDQISLVNELVERIRSETVRKLTACPDTQNWDGHELRCLLAAKFEDAAKKSVIRKEPRSRRARSYRNTALVCNL